MVSSLSRVLIAVGVGLFLLVSGMRPEQVHHATRHASNPYNFVSSKGRGNLSSDCADFPGKRVVLVTVTSEYFDMFKNWLRTSARFFQDTEHLHVIAEDEDVVAELEALRAHIKLDFSLAAPVQQGSLIQADPKFGDKAYGTVVWRRPAEILNMLQKGCSVLYVDIDTIWKYDPFVEIEASGHADLFLTDDDPIKKVDMPNLCTCFMYFHPTATAVSLLQNWASSQSGNRNQVVFNEELEKFDDIEYNVLPSKKFPPGFWSWPTDFCPDAVILHANYLTGLSRKINFFRFHNAWQPLVPIFSA